MSRISALELQYTDLEWYAIDRKGNVAVFLSAGEGNVPEFVCEEKERTEALIEFFENAERNGFPVICGAYVTGAADMAREMAARGVYCYDAVSGQRHYKRLACPELPLALEILPERIRNILVVNQLDVDDFSQEELIRVPHAYE